MTSWKTTAVLVAAAVGLTAWWVIVERPHMGEELYPGRLFFSLVREDIERIEIAKPTERIVLARGAGGAWRLQMPVAYDAGVGPVDALVSAIVFLESKVEVAEGAEGAFPAGGPALTLRFRAQGEDHVIEIGNRHMSKSLAYYRCGTRLFLGEELLKVQCERPGQEWRDKSVVPLTPDQVGGVVIDGGGRKLALERSPRGVWLMRMPLAARADAAVVQNLLDHLNALAVAEFIGDDGKAPRGDYGLDAPRWQVRVTPLGGRKEILLAIGKAREGATPPEMFVARADLPQVFRVEDTFTEALTKDIDDWREQRVLPFAESGWVRSVAVKGLTCEYSLTRATKESDWLLVNTKTGRQWKTPRQRGEVLVDSVGQLRVGQFLPGKPMGAERMRVTVTVEGLEAPMELIFGDEQAEGRCLVRRKGVEGEPDETLEVGSTLAERLADDVQWQPLVRAEIPEDRLLGFDLRTEKGKWLLLRVADWQADGFPNVALNQTLVQEAAKLVIAPTATYFEPSPKPPEELKLTRALCRVRVSIPEKRGEFPYYELLVGKEVDPPRALSYVKLDTDPTVVIMDPTPLLKLAEHLAEVCK